MNPAFVLRPDYIAYFRDFSGTRSRFWIAALAASILVHGLAFWQASRYTPRAADEDFRVEVRMIEEPPPPPPAPPPSPPTPPEAVVPPPPKPVPKPPKEQPRRAPPPILAAPPAPAAPSGPVVPVQPAPTPLPPIEVPPPPPAAPMSPSPEQPAAPVVPAAPVEDENALLEGFGRELSRVFAERKVYPRLALMRNMQGKVKLRLDFAQGALVNITLLSSSGHPVLDDGALADARRMKLPTPTGSLARKTFSLIIPVDYTIR
jgi:protein TonB